MAFPWVHTWVRSLSLAVRDTSEEKLGSSNFKVMQVQKRKWAILKCLSKQNNDRYPHKGKKQAKKSAEVLRIWD